VDPSIRPEVWEFLLGCYALGTTAESRSQLRTARRYLCFFFFFFHFLTTLPDELNKVIFSDFLFSEMGGSLNVRFSVLLALFQYCLILSCYGFHAKL
jgi:hypothetical protein